MGIFKTIVDRSIVYCGCSSGGHPAPVGEPTPIEEEIVVEMAEQPIPYSEQMSFPAQFMLPMSVYMAINAPSRSYTIASDDQDVPLAVIEWLMSDSRYRKWFD